MTESPSEDPIKGNEDEALSSKNAPAAAEQISSRPGPLPLAEGTEKKQQASDNQQKTEQGNNDAGGLFDKWLHDVTLVKVGFVLNAALMITSIVQIFWSYRQMDVMERQLDAMVAQTVEMRKSIAQNNVGLELSRRQAKSGEDSLILSKEALDLTKAEMKSGDALAEEQQRPRVEIVSYAYFPSPAAAVEADKKQGLRTMPVRIEFQMLNAGKRTAENLIAQSFIFTDRNSAKKYQDELRARKPIGSITSIGGSLQKMQYHFNSVDIDFRPSPVTPAYIVGRIHYEDSIARKPYDLDFCAMVYELNPKAMYACGDLGSKAPVPPQPNP